MEVDQAFDLISHAIDAGRAAHGYLIVGNLVGNCRELARRVLQKLFPDALEQVEKGSHPDIVILAPEGAKGIVKVDAMREELVAPMELKSYSGGWKVGVIVGADRMEAGSANAFLKSLEEPPEKTLYLLLTDQPDKILPTIVSRAQRIDLPRGETLLAADEVDEIERDFRQRDCAALVRKLAERKEALETPDYRSYRKAFYQVLMDVARSLMAGEEVPRYQAFRNVEAVEEAFRMSEESLGDEAVLSFLTSRMSFPK